jgi:hypothetical protein
MDGLREKDFPVTSYDGIGFGNEKNKYFHSAAVQNNQGFKFELCKNK